MPVPPGADGRAPRKGPDETAQRTDPARRDARAGRLRRPGVRHPGRDRGGRDAIRSITPITTVYTYGQKVSAVAVEYGATVNPRTLDNGTFGVADTIYNFRFNPIEDLPKLADRTVTRTYTNNAPTPRADHRSTPGRYVIVELDPADPGGWTVIVSKCPTFLCSVKVNPELPTRVVQRKDVHAAPGRGKGKGPVLARATPRQSRPVTEASVDPQVDEFRYGSFLSAGMVLPYPTGCRATTSRAAPTRWWSSCPDTGWAGTATTSAYSSPPTSRRPPGRSRAGPAAGRT